MSTAVQSEVLSEAILALQRQQLDAIPSARIVRRALPTFSNLSTPAIVVAQSDQTVDPQGGDTENDLIIYRFFVAIAWADNRSIDDLKLMERGDRWIEQARQAFHAKRLPIASPNCAQDATVVQGRQYVPEQYRNNLGVHYWLVSQPVREVRADD